MPGSDWTSGRCASSCSASSPPTCPRTTCTAVPRSSNCRERSWSAALGDAKVPVIVGPTAVGKTAVALALAAHLPIEVISADSRQIYQRLDIGTAKPTRKERARVTHHGLDVVEPGTRYSAGRFARDAVLWIEEVRNRSRLPLVVGGTGLSVRALAAGPFREPDLDPARPRSLGPFAARLGP